jgi:hypothetical protein
VKIRTALSIALGVSLLVGGPAAIDAQERLKDPITPFKQNLLQQLRGKRFADLEKLEQELRVSKSRFSGGDWKLYHFYDAMSGGLLPKHAAIDSDWVELITLQNEWRATAPKSSVPLLLLAQTYTFYGWDARSGADADKVSQHQFDVFKARLNQAASYLNESRRLSNANPQWFATALRIACGLGWEKNRTKTLFDEGVALEPLYQHTYALMAVYLLPRWYGEPGEWERFASDSTARVGGQQGFAIYHYVIVRISHQHTIAEMFRDNAVNWRRIQASYTDGERLYGEGREAMNAMCWLAVAARDNAAARRYFARIGDSWDPATWVTRQKFDDVKRWVELHP